LLGERAVVLEAADLPPGRSFPVKAFGTTIALFNVDGDLFALENRCAHHGAPLCHGRVSGALLPSAPGEYRYGREGRVLTCPWHGWEYDLETGKTLFDSGIWVRTFEACWEDGKAVLYDRRAETPVG